MKIRCVANVGRMTVRKVSSGYYAEAEGDVHPYPKNEEHRGAWVLRSAVSDTIGPAWARSLSIVPLIHVGTVPIGAGNMDAIRTGRFRARVLLTQTGFQNAPCGRHGIYPVHHQG